MGNEITKKMGVSGMYGKMLEKLVAAAKAAGVTAELEAKDITVDHTWGHLTGLVFFGEYAERAARFCEAWIARHEKGSYNCQKAGIYRGPKPIWFGPTGHHIADKLDGTERIGHVVSTFYYPCAE